MPRFQPAPTSDGRRSRSVASLAQEIPRLPANYVPKLTTIFRWVEGSRRGVGSIIQTMVIRAISEAFLSVGRRPMSVRNLDQAVQTAIRSADRCNSAAGSGRRSGRAQPPPRQVHRRSDAALRGPTFSKSAGVNGCNRAPPAPIVWMSSIGAFDRVAVGCAGPPAMMDAS